MNNARRATQPPPAKVRVQLIAFLSGDGEVLPPGSVIEVPAIEAARLIEIGAAKAVA